MSAPLGPGSVLGVVGGGQLGRMFAMAAQRMGYHVHVYSPVPQGPATQIAGRETVASYTDLDALAAFARSVDAVTFELEHVPQAALETLDRLVPTRPGPEVIRIAQDRLLEKRTLQRLGYPVAPFLPVGTTRDLVASLRRIGSPAVLKSTQGYDGKGQVLIGSVDDGPRALEELGTDQAVLEQWIPIDRELSVVVVRDSMGGCVTYGPFQNVHQEHVLDISSCPAELPARVGCAALEIATDLAATLRYTGVLCVEYFLDTHGRLLVNEIAPRPHNSGHLSIEAHATSQFEQQVRVVAGLPAGSATQIRSAAMANLLGKHLEAPLDYSRSLAIPDACLHWYGKTRPDHLRKMGHITATAHTASDAILRVRAARSALRARDCRAA